MPQVNATQKPSLSIPEGIGDLTKVRGRLALLGWPSMASWARAHGYDQQIVRWTVQVWGNRTDRKPHGGLTRQVMRDLRHTFEIQKTPAMHEAEKAGDFQRG